jgi:2-isopropylmalate synthase
VANSLAAVAAGARQVECTINGIGERAGNASLEEFAMIMRVRPDHFPFDTAIVSQQLFPASQLLSEITGVAVQPNKAIIGRNAFAHEAGIHQDGMIKNPLTYEIMTPQSVGVAGTLLVLGKHSGRHAVGLRCEQLGFPLQRSELDEIYSDFVTLADNLKAVEDWHLLELIGKMHKRHSFTSPDVSHSQPASATHAFQAVPHVTGGDNGKEQGAAFLATADREREQDDYLWGV